MLCHLPKNKKYLDMWEIEKGHESEVGSHYINKYNFLLLNFHILIFSTKLLNSLFQITYSGNGQLSLLIVP
jgi:hypothetical protein